MKEGRGKVKEVGRKEGSERHEGSEVKEMKKVK
jgi:hypothetical protein